MFLVMKGVIGVYIRLKTGEELFTDYLGVGSLIGSYSVIEQEIMIIGFRVMSQGGASLIQFKSDAFKILENNNK
jgi:hypothetical protein